MTEEERDMEIAYEQEMQYQKMQRGKSNSQVLTGRINTPTTDYSNSFPISRNKNRELLFNSPAYNKLR